jgi:hypothetical protein
VEEKLTVAPAALVYVQLIWAGGATDTGFAATLEYW